MPLSSSTRLAARTIGSTSFVRLACAMRGPGIGIEGHRTSHQTSGVRLPCGHECRMGCLSLLKGRTQRCVNDASHEFPSAQRNG